MKASSCQNKNVHLKDIKRKVLNIVGIILCILLLPILIINCILIVKGMTNKEEVPSLGGYSPLIVLTESMDPTIQAGDLIICKKTDPYAIEIDDVISFFDPDSNQSVVVTHRVVKIIIDEENNTLFFKTKGDNNDIEDRTLIPAENLIGKWNGARVKGLGHVVLFMQSTAGLILCIFVPVMLFVTYEIIHKKNKDRAREKTLETLQMELNELKALQSQQQEESDKDGSIQNEDA